MHLIDDIDLMFSHHRGQPRPVDQVADIFNMGLIRRIDLNDVGMRSLDRGFTVFAFIARRMIRIGTVHCSGKQSCHGGLACSSRSAEKIGMAHLVLRNRIADRPYDIFLADQFIKGLGPVFLI